MYTTPTRRSIILEMVEMSTPPSKTDPEMLISPTVRPGSLFYLVTGIDKVIVHRPESFSPFLVSMQLDGKEYRDNKKDSQHRSNGNE